tara:strand:+ start:656 stop:6319 length:5664 start_codon:yes stop_codon:yes gene_type:complete
MLEYIVDGQIVEVDPKDKELFLEKYPNATEQKSVEPDFQTPTTPGAVVEETAAPDTESKSEDISLGLPEKVKNIYDNLPKPLQWIGSQYARKVRKGAIGALDFTNFLGGIVESAEGAAETALTYRSDQLVRSGKITQEEQNYLLNEISDGAFAPLTDIFDQTQRARDVLADFGQEDPNRTIYEELEQGNFGDAIDKLENGLLQAIPSVAAAFAGPAGMAAIFTSATGSNYKTKVDADPSKRGDTETFGWSLAQGGVELVSEMVTRGIVKGFGKMTLAPNTVKNIYKATTKNLAGRILTGAALEGSSEVGAQEVNRYLDYIWDEDNAFGYQKTNPDGSIKYDVGNILQRSFDTFLISSIVGGGLGAASKTPGSKRYTEERLSPVRFKKDNLKIVEEISKLETEYVTNPNPIIENKILELQQKVIDNKLLNERVLNSFEDSELVEYARDKIAISEARDSLNNIEDVNIKNSIEKAIEQKEQKVDAQYNDKLSRLIKILEKPIKPEGALLSDFGILSAADKLREVALDKAKQTKISNDVQKIYEEKGTEGAFEIIEKFKPITNKLVRKRREAPNYDEQLLRDEIETGERGILDLIREYKPDSGVPLSGYINKFLPARAIEASKRVLGEEFTQDVTEIRESRIELDDTTQEVLDFVRTEPKAKEQLRDIAGITKESVQKDATEILKGKLPGIVEKSGRDQNEILTAINNASKLKISDSVLEEMGGNFNNTQEQNSRFATFLDTNYDAIIKSIPDAVKNKLPVFEKIDTGKREKTKEGKKIFEYKTPTKEQMLSFYTEGGLTTLRARKLKLADILAQEIGKDAIAEVLADANIQKEFLERQELLGKEIPQDAIPRLLQRIDRLIESIDTKSDGTLAMGISPVLIKRAFKGGLKVFRATLKKTNDFQKALTAFIKKVKTYFKSAEEGKIAEEVIKENVTINNIESLDLDAMIDEVAKRVNTNRGIAYERVIYSNAANVKNPLFKIIGEQTEKGGAADIQFEIAGKRFDVEAKLESPQYSSINGQYNFNNKVFTNSKNTKISEGLQITLDNILEKAKPALDKYKQRATELGVNLETSGSKMPIDIFNQLKEEGLQNNITTREVVSQSVIEELYNKKDQYYIQIKGKGLYYIGKNPLNLPVPKLEGDVTITFRIARSSRDKNNNVTPTLRFLPDDINITSKKSDHSIDTANGINKLLKSDNILDLIAKQKSIEKYNSKDLNKDFNKFLEKSTGIGAQKVFSKAKAEARAKTVRKGFGDYFVPPGAEDFAGLMHKTLAKGKEGEKQLKFYQDNLYTPYNVANENITRERAAMFEDFRALKKKLSNVPKKLKKLTKGGDFTNDQAVRVYMWNKLGQKVPGLSETDLKSLVKEVSNDKELSQFANELLNITKGDGYVKPENNWMSGNIATDLMGLMNSTKRSKHLEVWQNNVDQIFSEQNLNKLEAAYGKKWVTNLKKTLERMKTGMNRKWGGDAVLQSYLDWVNGSVGAIMFLNTRSAVLQTISNINYLNFSDNNPLQAAKAFANQKQYWSDFKTIFNSDYLQERRGGNKINVNESELALAAEKGGIQGTISLLLNKGFIFTKIADSFAIASGGASMYRNRINTYIKEGLSEKEATEKAFIDFKAITEETQQSSRPDRISEQQASNAGRLLLAFANTPMQYNRIIKKNAQDLIARRGDPKEKISKIIYYSTIQNLIFNAMQKALFALAFAEDEEDEEEVSKYALVGEGMADSLLRGSGLTGNAVVAVKNVAIDVARRSGRPRPNFKDAAWKAATLSPPINNKLTKVRGALYSLDYVTPRNIFDPSLDNPALSAGANIISATTNIPLDRALRKAQNIEAAMSDEAEWWQSTALLMGWGSWELGMQKPKKQSKKKTEVPKPLFDKSQNIFNKRKSTIFK